MKYSNHPHGFWMQEGRNTWLLFLTLVAAVIGGLAFVMDLTR